MLITYIRSGEYLVPAQAAYTCALEASVPERPNGGITSEEFAELQRSGVTAEKLLANLQGDLFTSHRIFRAAPGSRDRVAVSVGGAMDRLRKRPGSRLFGGG